MKLVRFGEIGAEVPGLVDRDGHMRSLAGIISDITPATIASDDLKRLREIDPACLPIVDGNPRIGPCVAGMRNFIGIGLNYADHAAEAGVPLPAEPIIFLKAVSSIIGAYDDVILPRGSQMTDWEVELGVVVGQPAKYVSKQDALSYVAGYCIVNDYSERDYQLRSQGQWAKTSTQWAKGKSCDTFGPIGPWLVTTDEIVDPQNLSLRLDVDGICMQDSNTSRMVFDVAHLISYVSQYMTLMPGDIIATGTPAGVGMGRSPEVYLKPGQTVRLGIEGLGYQEQRIYTADARGMAS